MKEFEKYITVKEFQKDEGTISCLDFDYSGEGEQSDSSTNHKFIGLKSITKNVILTQTKLSKVKELLIENIIKLANKNFVPELFSAKNIETAKVKNKVAVALGYIATQGRIGSATNILISEYNYKKYDLNDLCQARNLDVLFDDSVTDIYIYRKNKVENPGLFLLCSDNQKLRLAKLYRILNKNVDDKPFKYEFVTTGYHPEKQFVKIEL